MFMVDLICPGPESNRHPVFTGADFKSARLPIPPPGRIKNSYLIWVKILLKAREKQWGISGSYDITQDFP